MQTLWTHISEQSETVTTSAWTLLVLGVLLSLSIVVDTISRRTALPRISLLVLVGVGYALIQQGLLGHDAEPLNGLREPLINLALVMVAFLLGGELTWSRLKSTGPLIIALSVAVVIGSLVTVFAGLWLLGYSLVVAVSLAAISVATDPAAVSEAVAESDEKSDSKSDAKSDEKSLVARVILGIVAIDDAWGIIVFGLCMALLSWIGATSGEASLVHTVWELGGAVLLGLALGFPAAWLTGQLKPGRPTQAEALALMLLMAGFSSYLNVSALLTAMVAGFVIVNVSSHHTRSFNEIEQIEWPFLVFFFVLAGASLKLAHLSTALGLVGAYIVLRSIGRYLGGYLGVLAMRRREPRLKTNIGLGLLPQAGVAMGMALLAAERFPEQGQLIVATVVTSTIIFELFGPLLVKRVIANPGKSDAY
ncbi:cation:proton antiporter [Halomonas vilamensis]|uniref:Cation:proton antiporter n=1 Tax=Vreelandella vilamensis TaxID=531309 RepID=A0ABU1H0Y2_9GAMM|nr:cation:proton antiporter [Halomonas vilamensis]MDR5897953.1 cation:proton antiporter [Halomonas vilamensis]